MPSAPSTPRSAYIHVPFCKYRCGYCDFAIVANRDDLVGAYLQAIATELSWLGEPREVDTLYFGGGTPSHLDAASLATLCDDGAALASAGRRVRVDGRGESRESHGGSRRRCWPSMASRG